MIKASAMSFGELLRQCRNHAGKTMGEVARYLNLSVSYISDIERNCRLPPADKIHALATYLEADELLLRAAAARSRGSIDFEAAQVSPRAQMIAAALLRGNMPEERLLEIQKVLDLTELDDLEF